MAPPAKTLHESSPKLETNRCTCAEDGGTARDRPRSACRTPTPPACAISAAVSYRTQPSRAGRTAPTSRRARRATSTYLPTSDVPDLLRRRGHSRPLSGKRSRARTPPVLAAPGAGRRFRFLRAGRALPRAITSWQSPKAGETTLGICGPYTGLAIRKKGHRSP